MKTAGLIKSGTLTVLTAALLGAFSTGTFAADYFVVVPVKGRTAVPSAPSAPAITVSLNSATLPVAERGVPYSFDFNQALSVTGDPAFDSTAVTWRVASGSIPSGLSLSTGGVLSGTPLATGDSPFAISAAYKNKTAQTNYALTVDAPTQLEKSGSADFGTVLLDASAQKTLTVSNSGSQSISQVYLSQSPVVTGLTVTNTCGTSVAPITLAPGASCTVQLDWTPTDAGSLAGKELVFTSSKNTLTVPLTGVAEPSQVSALLRYESTPFVDDKGGVVTKVGTAPTQVIGDAAVGTSSANYAGLGGNILPLSASDFVSSDFTVEAYVKPTAYGGAIFSRDNNENVNYGNALLQVNANGTVAAFCNPNSGNLSGRIYTPTSTAVLNKNAWNHVAWTRKGTIWTLFVNGKKQASSTGSCTFRSTDVTRIGHTLYASGPTAFFPGQIDHFRITKGRSLYNADFVPSAQ